MHECQTLFRKESEARDFSCMGLHKLGLKSVWNAWLTARKDEQYAEIAQLVRADGSGVAYHTEDASSSLVFCSFFFDSKEWVVHLIAAPVSPNGDEPCKNWCLTYSLLGLLAVLWQINSIVAWSWEFRTPFGLLDKILPRSAVWLALKSCQKVKSLADVVKEGSSPFPADIFLAGSFGESNRSKLAAAWLSGKTDNMQG